MKKIKTEFSHFWNQTLHIVINDILGLGEDNRVVNIGDSLDKIYKHRTYFITRFLFLQPGVMCISHRRKRDETRQNRVVRIKMPCLLKPRGVSSVQRNRQEHHHSLGFHRELQKQTAINNSSAKIRNFPKCLSLLRSGA